MSKLPQEILDISIDFLHLDFPSLMTCSLVCRDWLSSSRLHMFDNLAIYHALSAAKRGKPMNMHVFFDLIDDPHNTFAPFLRTIVIEVTGKGLNTLVRKLVDAGVHLVKLTITLFGDEVCLRDFFPLNASIKSLTIKSRAFSSCEAFAPALSFAADFPSLRIFSIDTPLTLNIPHGALKYVNASNFRGLERLDLCARETEPIFEWLLSTGWESRLEMLRVRIYRTEHRTCGPIACLNAFLHKTGVTLKYLDIGVQYAVHQWTLGDIDPDPEFGSIDLSGLSLLRTIRAEIHDVHSVCDALESAKSSPLEDISIDAVPWGTRAQFDSYIECRRDEIWTRVGDIVAKQWHMAKLDVRVPRSYSDEGIALVRHCLTACTADVRFLDSD